MFLIRTAAVFLAALVGVAASSSFISDCPVTFEDKNYTIITSKCKAPLYPAQPCCEAFKEFACPYAEILNDLTNNCASDMFSYISTKTNYPQGLFSSMCRDGKEGLDCSSINIAPLPSQDAADSSNTNEGLLSIIFPMCGLILVFLFSFNW